VRTVDITLIDEELLQETFKGLTHFVSASMNRDLQNYPMKEEVKGPLHEFLGLIPKVRTLEREREREKKSTRPPGVHR
jgi:hypothetical protein